MVSAGLAPVVANASNALAIAPGHLLAVIADRHKLPVFGPRLLMSLGACIAGGLGGALILLAAPDHLFVLPVPAPIAFATGSVCAFAKDCPLGGRPTGRL